MAYSFLNELQGAGIREDDFNHACAFLHRAILEMNGVNEDPIGIELEQTFFLSEVMYFVLAKNDSFSQKLLEVATPDNKILKLTPAEVLISKALTSASSLSLPYDVVTQSLYILMGHSTANQNTTSERIDLLKSFLGDSFESSELSFLSKHHLLENEVLEEEEEAKLIALSEKAKELFSTLNIKDSSLLAATEVLLTSVTSRKISEITGVSQEVLAHSFFLPLLFAKNQPHSPGQIKTSNLSPKNLTNLEFFVSDFFLESAKEVELSKKGALIESPLYYKLVAYHTLLDVTLPVTDGKKKKEDEAIDIFPNFLNIVFGEAAAEQALASLVLNAQAVKEDA